MDEKDKAFSMFAELLTPKPLSRGFITCG